jgi:hypothetical protein
MVACQWNYSNPSSQSQMFRIGSESARWSCAHLRTLFVLIEGFFGATYQIISDRTGRTGRRWVTVEENNVSRYSSLDLSIPKVKLLMILQGTPLAQPPHHLLMTLGRWRCVERLHIPAQVCEFFINSLQRHREVCMCLWEGGGGWMLSSLWISRGAVVSEVVPSERTG